jgi:hypothetical protein
MGGGAVGGMHIVAGPVIGGSVSMTGHGIDTDAEDDDPAADDPSSD